ncbi:MAG: penicillin acylase family protein [Steroidobacteraceae bacterium]
MKRALAIAAVALVGLAALAAAGAWLALRASLPELDGEQAIAGLSAGATLQRDDHGVATLTAATRADLARALGFAHAQDRFFQMDLQRRAAAGELAELLGPSLLELDVSLRRHRFRAVAATVAASLPADHRGLLAAYAEGVNAGLASLRGRPWEYWLLGQAPRAWRVEDSILCVQAMFLQLQDPTGHGLLQRGLLRESLPGAATDFLLSGAPEWEAAVDGTPRPEVTLPTPAQFDLRAHPEWPSSLPDTVRRQQGGLGSNNWAVAGTRTASGAALVANDMHLGLRVPVIWYRARLVQPGAQGFEATGVTLPGTPLVVVGSNGHLAWGFTNSYGEYESVIRLVPGAQPGQYLTAAGPVSLQYVEEVIHVKGGASRTLKVALTPWGPVMGEDWEGKPYVLAWSAQEPAALNLELIRLERSRNIADALQAASGFGIPAQNLMLGDAGGHIAWTIGGRIPLRTGDAGMPQRSDDAHVGFGGWATAEQQPRVVDPPEGLLWSANARVVGGESQALLGDGGMDRGARAGQIHADLAAAPLPVTEDASLSVQLDDRARFLERWRDLLLGLLGRLPAAQAGAHAPSAQVLRQWSDHARPDDAGYRLIAAFRAQVEARVFYMLIAPARQRAPHFDFEIPSAFEGPLWRMVSQRPRHLLAPRYADWDALLLEALLASERPGDHCVSVTGCPWGRVNEVRIRHPLSGALPGLSGLLDMPVVRVPGGREDMPRVQGPDFGASERFSVSPGHESAGYFHMPGGQSGHPLSPWSRSDFDAWASGRPEPFLPGTARHTLRLVPAAR